MDQTKLEDWKLAVAQLNEDASNLIHSRDELYKVMADDIKGVFAQMDLHPQNVHIESSAHKISVKFQPNDPVIIDPVIISQLNMKFRVTGGYNDSAIWRIVLIFYPFEE